MYIKHLKKDWVCIILDTCFEKLDSLRSQKETGLSFNFAGAVYTIIPKSGVLPRFLQPFKSKTAMRNLICALEESKENGYTIIAAWVGMYRTDMFLIDDVDLVIQQLSNLL